MLCASYGHQVIALGNLCPIVDTTDELDSYMYQTVGHQLVKAWAACAGLPLFRGRLQGSSKQQASSFHHLQGSCWCCFHKQIVSQLEEHPLLGSKGVRSL